jgi:hypothetical protein
MFASIKLYTNFTESIRRNYLKNNATNENNKVRCNQIDCGKRASIT